MRPLSLFSLLAPRHDSDCQLAQRAFHIIGTLFVVAVYTMAKNFYFFVSANSGRCGDPTGPDAQRHRYIERHLRVLGIRLELFCDDAYRDTSGDGNCEHHVCPCGTGECQRVRLQLLAHRELFVSLPAFLLLYEFDLD
jgi:hypothetical protein